MAVVGEVFTAAIVVQFDAAAGALVPKTCVSRLGDGLVGGEAVAAVAGLVAEALCVPMLDGC